MLRHLKNKTNSRIYCKKYLIKIFKKPCTNTGLNMRLNTNRTTFIDY